MKNIFRKNKFPKQLISKKLFSKHMMGMPFKKTKIFNFSDYPIWKIIFVKDDSIFSCMF